MTFSRLREPTGKCNAPVPAGNPQATAAHIPPRPEERALRGLLVHRKLTRARLEGRGGHPISGLPEIGIFNSGANRLEAEVRSSRRVAAALRRSSAWGRERPRV